jgi:hypothetical protein
MNLTAGINIILDSSKELPAPSALLMREISIVLDVFPKKEEM